jgi:hypothetical protein
MSSMEIVLLQPINNAGAKISLINGNESSKLKG